MAQFTNRASVSYNGMTANSNIVTGEITQVINVWKDATYKKYKIDDIITYVITIKNSGSMDYTNLTITDDLGSYGFETGTVVPLTFTGDPILYYINGVFHTAPEVTPGPPLVITGIDVPAGGNTIIVYRAKVNEYAPLGTGEIIENLVAISGGGLTNIITEGDYIDFDDSTSLTILKALNPTTVVENGEIVYTFTIQNTGATEASAAANVIIHDTFTPPLSSPITVTLNKLLWPITDNYTYDEGSGEFATIKGRITVPAATFIQDAETGKWIMSPGETVVTVTGKI